MFTCPRNELPYNPDDPVSIEAHGRRLEGRTVIDIARELDYRQILESQDGGKGKVGNLVEAWFRLAPNSRPESDFPCGVEIKVAPLKPHKTSTYTSKERMVVGVIPFNDIVREEWETAHARQKLERILVVTYKHDFTNAGQAGFLISFLWSPPAIDTPQLRTDWTRTRDTVRMGHAHLLSESIGRYLGPSTKGTGTRNNPAADLVQQPFSPILAKRRAFALKARYIVVQVRKRLAPEQFVRLADPRTRIETIESSILSKLHSYTGMSVQALCDQLEIPVLGTDKSLAARLLNAALGIEEGKSIEELETAGVQVKTVHARKPDSKSRGKYLQPFEAMSFPAIEFEDLLDEEWGPNVGILDELQRLLVIPTFSDNRKTPQADRILGPAFFWSPTANQEHIIEEDWTELIDQVQNGAAAEFQVYNPDRTPRMRKTSKRIIPWVENHLPGERDGRILHLRPHTGDADDKVPVPGGQITRQSFWLNRSFVRELLVASFSDQPDQSGLTLQ